MLKKCIQSIFDKINNKSKKPITPKGKKVIKHLHTVSAAILVLIEISIYFFVFCLFIILTVNLFLNWNNIIEYINSIYILFEKM